MVWAYLLYKMTAKVRLKCKQYVYYTVRYAHILNTGSLKCSHTANVQPLARTYLCLKQFIMPKWFERGVVEVSQLILNTDVRWGDLPLVRDNIVKTRGSSQPGMKKGNQRKGLSPLNHNLHNLNLCCRCRGPHRRMKTLEWVILITVW